MVASVPACTVRSGLHSEVVGRQARVHQHLDDVGGRLARLPAVGQQRAGGEVATLVGVLERAQADELQASSRRARFHSELAKIGQRRGASTTPNPTTKSSSPCRCQICRARSSSDPSRAARPSRSPARPCPAPTGTRPHRRRSGPAPLQPSRVTEQVLRHVAVPQQGRRDLLGDRPVEDRAIAPVDADEDLEGVAQVDQEGHRTQPLFRIPGNRRRHRPLSRRPWVSAVLAGE